jgi:hypothetical protein
LSGGTTFLDPVIKERSPFVCGQSKEEGQGDDHPAPPVEGEGTAQEAGHGPRGIVGQTCPTLQKGGHGRPRGIKCFGATLRSGRMRYRRRDGDSLQSDDFCQQGLESGANRWFARGDGEDGGVSQER